MKTARQARIAAGFPRVEDAAARVHISASYLRQIERHGGANSYLARRLARLYQCDAGLFLWGSHGPIPSIRAARPQTTKRPRP